MNIAVSIGAFLLQDYVELQLCYVRKIWGDVPVLVSDGKSENSEKIANLADKYGAYYWCDEVNAGHFQGCMANAVNAVKFAQDQGCDYALKLNQRLLLVNPDIKGIVANVFEHAHIALAMPGRPEAIQLNPRSRFHSSFPVMPDAIFMRVKDFDPEWMVSRYRKRCENKSDKYAAYTEIFWMDLVNNEFKGRWSALHCLTMRKRGWPCFFIRKAMAGPGDYMEAAQSVGLKLGAFPIQEWATLKASNYMPIPRV